MTELRISAGQSRYSDDPHRTDLSLRIEDAEASQMVVDVTIPADAVLRLLGGSGGERVDGWVIPARLAHRLGKRMETHMEKVPDEVVDGIGYKRGAREAVSQEWAEKYAAENDWETADARATNSGMRAVFHRWVEIEEPTP